MREEYRKVSFQRIEQSLRKLAALHGRASTSCWKTYDLNLSFVEALMVFAWGTATALYSQCIGTRTRFPVQYSPFLLRGNFNCEVLQINIEIDVLCERFVKL